MNNKTKRLMTKGIYWSIFSVLMSLIPLFVVGMIQYYETSNLDLKLIAANGELLLITCMITGTSIGLLIESKSEKNIWNVIVGGLTVILFLTSAIFFGYVVDDPKEADAAQRLFSISKMIFTLGYISSLYCVMLSENERLLEAKDG